jgi:hypothetical protein
MTKDFFDLDEFREAIGFYENILSQLESSQVLNLKARSAKTVNLEKQFPGLKELLVSIGTLALERRPKKLRIREWNPVSQRVFVDAKKIVTQQSLHPEMDHSIQAIDRFLSVSHEAAHVYLWEPFFSGSCSLFNKDEFVNYCLVFEGFCFWFVDIVVNRSLRLRLPDGEFVRSRNAYSESRFHPYRAFEAMGMRDPIKILDVYLRAFLGERTVLFKKKNQIYSKELLYRIGAFYFVTIRPASKLYEQFRRVGIFSEFKARFCDIPGLPTLLNKKVHPLMAKNPYRYCLKIGKDSEKLIQKDDDVSKRVRVRRLLQTRAYYVFLLNRVIVEENYFSTDGASFHQSAVLTSINSYLTGLEKLLLQLAEKQDLSLVLSQLKELDKFYSKNVRGKFLKSTFWVAKRKMIAPPLETKEQVFGFGMEEKLNTRERARVQEYIVDNWLNEDRNGFLLKKSKRSEFFLNLLNTSPADSAKFSECLKMLLTHSDFLPFWSVSLDEINPEKNEFREVLFLYGSSGA